MACITDVDMIAIISTGDYLDKDGQIENFILMGKEKREKLVDLMLQEINEDNACELFGEALGEDWEEFTISIPYAEQLLNSYRKDLNGARWKLCEYLEVGIDEHITKLYPDIMGEMNHNYQLSLGVTQMAREQAH